MREHKNISIADQIFEQLEREILAGKYQRGEILSELALAKELGVSRTPVREAIRRLQQEDFLEETGRGLVVVGISKDDMLDMYEIRLQIEGEAARRAAKNITDDSLRELRDILDLQQFYCEKSGDGSSDQIKNLDSRFHEIFYRACGSKPYYTVLISLHKRMTKFRKASLSRQTRARQAIKEHTAILKALEAHDEQAAEEAALTHARSAMDRMRELDD